MVDLVSDVIEKNEELREGLWVDLGIVLVLLPSGLVEFLGSKGRLLLKVEHLGRVRRVNPNPTRKNTG
ncbi:hypothetical protein Patl1_36685 [Pistacia atlantica]|nr:hypothetical protein Patl1_36685 [Pistacia atlantica]